MPDVPGAASTGVDGVADVEAMLGEQDRFPSALSLSDQARVGLRRVVVPGTRDSATGRSSFEHAELLQDGSGFHAAEVSPAPLTFGRLRDEPANLVGAEHRHVVAALADCLAVLIGHASRRARCSGDAVLKVRLGTGEGTSTWHVTITEPRPVIAEERRAAGAGTRGEPTIVDGVLALDAVASSTKELLLVVRLLALDVFSVFGIAPDVAITADGLATTAEMRRRLRRQQTSLRWSGHRRGPSPRRSPPVARTEPNW